MTRLLIVGCVTLCAILIITEQPPALAQSAASRADFGLPAERAGWDGVLAGLLSTFNKADVLALGEAHGRQADSDLRVRLIQHPDFARNVRFIAVECGAPSDQSMIDRYVSGDEVEDAQRLWARDRILEEFYRAVRGVNRTLPPAMRIRVLAVGLPNARASNASALAALQTEVLSVLPESQRETFLRNLTTVAAACRVAANGQEPGA